MTAQAKICSQSGQWFLVGIKEEKRMIKAPVQLTQRSWQTTPPS